MNADLASFPDRSQAIQTAAPERARLFYTGAAALLFVLMLIGFQQFYLHGRAFPNRPLTPQIRTLVIAHGLALTLWVVMMMVQPALVVKRRYALHMLVGKLGAALAACIVMLGVTLSIEWLRIDPSRMAPWFMTARSFMAVPFISTLIFAGFVATGILNRRRPEIHRPMMLLATLTVISAATDRIPEIVSLFDRTVWGATFGPFFPALVIGGVLLIMKWVLTGSHDRYFAAGWAGLVLADAGIIRLSTTHAWDAIANALLRT